VVPAKPGYTAAEPGHPVIELRRGDRVGRPGPAARLASLSRPGAAPLLIARSPGCQRAPTGRARAL